MRALLYGGPVLVGFVLGYFLSLPVNIIISILVVGFAAWSLWTTRNAEIGGLIGVIVAIEAGIGLAAMWVTIGVLFGVFHPVSLSWLLRS